jgi:hypothetical protein
MGMNVLPQRNHFFLDCADTGQRRQVDHHVLLIF